MLSLSETNKTNESMLQYIYAFDLINLMCESWYLTDPQQVALPWIEPST